MATFKNTEVNDTGFLQLPVGTQAERPNNPNTGYVRFNTDENKFEIFDGTEWKSL